VNRQFTPRWADKVDRLREMALAGAGATTMATDLGVTVSSVRAKAFRLGLSIHRGPRPARPRPEMAALPDVMPLVTAALADDPAGAPQTCGNRGTQRTSEKSWPVHLAAYVLNVELGFSAVRTGAAVQRDNKLVSYAVGRIEERRDVDPAFDDFLERLGDRARGLAA
jgi:hypothetical protein